MVEGPAEAGCCPVVEIDRSLAVGSDDPHADAGGGRHELGLQCLARGPGLTETGGEDRYSPRSHRACLADGVGGCRRRQHAEDQVHGSADVAERRVTAQL